MINMDCNAAVMTGKGAGAISTVLLYGDSSQSILKQIFKPVSEKSVCFDTGEILLGSIYDGSKKIDQVTIGCEAVNTFAIHCHGNPLIVKMIIQLLEKHNVRILTNDQLQIKLLSQNEYENAIALEAQIAQAQAVTLEGTKIILNQVDYGLNKIAHEWLSDIESLSLGLIKKQVDEIFKNSLIAKLIISGCKTILVGPPNTGKSTLLNCLSGKQKAIVTDISGTTRDWITAQCQLQSLTLELIDTAGLDENLNGIIDNASQKKTIELIDQADLILLVLDNSRDMEFDYNIFNEFTNKKFLTILNKSDLPEKFDINKLPSFLANIVKISAKEQAGIDKLISSIREILGVNNFNLQTPICFTERQTNLLHKIKQAESKLKIAEIIAKLLQIDTSSN